MPLLEGLKVIRSAIHGYGVIATRTFEKGEVLLYGDGFLWHEDDDFDDEYSLIVPVYNDEGEELPSMYWDLTCQSRWINHSCDPNTEVDAELEDCGKKATAWWTALRTIREGEELSYDYAFSGHLAIPCNCATTLCRGLIVDPDELDEIPTELRQHLRVPRALRSVGG